MRQLTSRNLEHHITPEERRQHCVLDALAPLEFWILQKMPPCSLLLCSIHSFKLTSYTLLGGVTASLSSISTLLRLFKGIFKVEAYFDDCINQFSSGCVSPQMLFFQNLNVSSIFSQFETTWKQSQRSFADVEFMLLSAYDPSDQTYST